MNDDNMIGGIILGLFATIGVAILLGSRMGFDDGLEKGKNEGIVFCMEKQKECKTTYDYLKLKENQK
jgi:hypothetical protein